MKISNPPLTSVNLKAILKEMIGDWLELRLNAIREELEKEANTKWVESMKQLESEFSTKWEKKKQEAFNEYRVMAQKATIDVLAMTDRAEMQIRFNF